MCQPRQSSNIQRLEAIRTHLAGLAAEGLSRTSSNYSFHLMTISLDMVNSSHFHCTQCWWGTASPSWGTGWFDGISFRSTHSPLFSPQTSCRTELWLPWLPKLLHTWPAATSQMPQESTETTNLNRTLSSAWRHSLLAMSTAVFRDCHHHRHRRPYSHSSQQLHQWWKWRTCR